MSLTSSPAKLQGQLILHTIAKVIRSRQHGFAKGKSRFSNLRAFYNGVTGWADEGRAVDVVCLDSRTASNAVSHDILNAGSNPQRVHRWPA